MVKMDMVDMDVVDTDVVCHFQKNYRTYRFPASPTARGLVKLTTYSIAKNSISERTLGLVIPTTRSN